jgi:hypothetical protein
LPVVAGSRAAERPLGLAVAVQHGLVLAVRLRRHHRCLGTRNQLTRVHRVLRPFRHADRDRDAACGLELSPGEPFDEARRQAKRIAGSTGRHDHAELLAADSADDVRGTYGLRRNPCQFGEELVALCVAVDVVHPLEVVQVEHQHGDRVM